MAAELDVPVFLHPPAEPVGSESVSGLPPRRAGRAFWSHGGPRRAGVRRASRATSQAEVHRGDGWRRHRAAAGRLDLAYQPRHWARSRGQGGRRWPPPAVRPAVGVAVRRGGPMIQQYQNKITQPPSTYIKRLWVDTAFLQRAPPAGQLPGEMGADHMLFGTDSPAPGDADRG